MQRPIERVLNRLHRVKKEGKGWTALCPAHDDKNPSLSIAEGDDGRVLLKCFTGCQVEAIVSAMGLEMTDLFPNVEKLHDKRQGGGGRGHTPSKKTSDGQTGSQASKNKGKSESDGLTSPKSDQVRRSDRATSPPGCTLEDYSKAKKLPDSFLKQIGLREQWYMGSTVVAMPYRDEHGEETAVKYRLALKDEGGWTKTRWRKGDKPFLYGLWRIDWADPPEEIAIVEGESDCHTLWYHEIPALGLPGAGGWNEERDARFFEKIQRINIVIEADQGGEAVRKWLEKSSIRDRAQPVIPRKYKDPSSLHIADPKKFKERWEKAVSLAVPWSEIVAQEANQEKTEAWEACKDLATSPDILAEFAKMLPQVDFVGENRTALLIFLALITRVFDWPTSIVAKGPSAAGKSYAFERVLKFFPASIYDEQSGMSEHALIYSEEPLKHRFLIIFEYTGASNKDFTNYIVRSLLTEGKIIYDTVEKTHEGLRPRRIVKEGPTGFLTTTTAVDLHPENETRMLSITIDDSPEQTARIIIAQANEHPHQPDLTAWHALQTWVNHAEHRVTIPFADRLARTIPPVAVRLRRDFKTVLTLVKAHAVLHQATRDRDEEGRIEATLADYHVVRSLVVDLMSEGVGATVSPTIRETVSAVADLLVAKTEPEATCTIAEITKELKIDWAATYRRVRKATTRGYLINKQTRKRQPALITLGDDLPEEIKLLPSVDELSDRLGEELGQALDLFEEIFQSDGLTQSDVGMSDANTSESLEKVPRSDGLTRFPGGKTSPLPSPDTRTSQKDEFWDHIDEQAEREPGEEG